MGNVMKQDMGYLWGKPSDSFIKALTEVQNSGVDVNKDESNKNLVELAGYGFTSMDDLCKTIEKLDAEANDYALKGLHGLAMGTKSKADHLRAAKHAHDERTMRAKEVAAAALPGHDSSGVPKKGANIMPPTVHVEAAQTPTKPKGMTPVKGTNGDMITKPQASVFGDEASPVITNQMGAIQKKQLPGQNSVNPRLNQT